jgi:hypothetical protein
LISLTGLPRGVEREGIMVSSEQTIEKLIATATQ